MDMHPLPTVISVRPSGAGRSRREVTRGMFTGGLSSLACAHETHETQERQWLSSWTPEAHVSLLCWGLQSQQVQAGPRVA